MEPGTDLPRVAVGVPDNPERRLVHETIYQALYVQGRVYDANWPCCCVLAVLGASLIADPMPGARVLSRTRW